MLFMNFYFLRRRSYFKIIFASQYLLDLKLKYIYIYNVLSNHLSPVNFFRYQNNKNTCKRVEDSLILNLIWDELLF